MLTIGEVVQVDTSGQFRSDVQLSDYEDPRLNLDLLMRYIFTTSAPQAAQRRMSSVDVLERLRNVFIIGRYENRMTITANYGHGKSHLALALANFFSRAAGSSEAEAVLKRIEQALRNPAQVANYKHFKQGKGEFLVVRLRGDTAHSLREQFLNGLESALHEHVATANVQLPFWYAKAEEFLKKLSGEELRKANKFLGTEETDVAELVSQIRQHGARERCRRLFQSLYGIMPDFGAEASLREAVLWAVDQYCGEGKPFGGLLVLFDEFSLFVQRYAQQGPNGDLQDLLNGISDRRSQSAFVAFSQHDPQTVAENFVKGPALESAKHELSRLPPDGAFVLYSLMESVIDAYLKQSESDWATLLENRREFAGPIAQAREVTLERFRRRYNDELRWPLDKFEQVVVKGCFPLHPLTTALLSTLKIQAGEDIGTARTALSFVLQRLEELKGQSVIVEGRPNYILPIDLVDFFEDRLSRDDYNNYRNACVTMENANALDEAHRRALKALLLQTIAGLRASGGQQLHLLAQMSGLSDDQVRNALNELARANAIRYDEVNHISSFWPASVSPRVLETLVREKIEVVVFDQQALDNLNNVVKPLSVDVSFGHPNDWAATQKILTEEFFTADTLRDLAQSFRVGAKGIEDGVRGILIWLVARSQDEISHLRLRAADVLAEAFPGDSPLPVVVVQPKKPWPELIESWRRKKVLEGLSQAERMGIGTIFYEQELKRAEASLGVALLHMRGDVEAFDGIQRQAQELVVPAAYRAGVNSLPHLSIQKALAACYHMAYQRSGFYDQYRVVAKGPNKLRDAVKKVALRLFLDMVGDGFRTLSKDDIQKQICDKFLVGEWGLLAPETLTIQEPTHRGVHAAWDWLDQRLSPGCKDRALGEIVVPLLNPPYGHDYNTLILLLAAWIGYHQRELRFSLGGRARSLREIQDFFDGAKAPKDFLDQGCTSSPITISRQDMDEVLDDARKIYERVQHGDRFTLLEAETALADLEQIIDDGSINAASVEMVKGVIGVLRADIEVAQHYDTEAVQILQTLDREPTLEALLRLQDVLGRMPTLGRVTAERPPLAELRLRWEHAIAQAVEATSQKYEQLRNLTDLGLHERELSLLKSRLKKLGLQPVIERADEALQRLRDKADLLKREASEAPVLAKIKAMNPSASLADLREYQNFLQGLSDVSGSTLALKERTLRRIESEIEQLQAMGNELPQALDRVQDLHGLEAWREQFLRSYDRYQGTDFETNMAAAKERSENLARFFEELIVLQSWSADTPANADRIELAVEEIVARFGSSLGKAQRDRIDQMRKSLVERVQAARAEAYLWLNNLETDCRKKDVSLAQLLRRLEEPRAFLAAEDQVRLSALKNDVRMRLDQDLMARIEDLFLSIKDRAKRYECLVRLQKVAGND